MEYESRFILVGTVQVQIRTMFHCMNSSLSTRCTRPLQLAGMTTPGRLIACIVITEEGGAVANSRLVGSSFLFSESQRTHARRRVAYQ